MKLAERFGENYERLFREGITLGNGESCLPAAVRCCPDSENIAFIELFEGKYHQVKRMFAAVENHVEKLVRIQMGGLEMHAGIGIGECMEILHNDVEKLLKPTRFDEVFSSFQKIFVILDKQVIITLGN